MRGFPVASHLKALCDAVTSGHERDLSEQPQVYTHSTKVEITSQREQGWK